MPNVLILCEYSSLNGGEQSLLATLKIVREEGFHLTAMAPAAGPLAREFAARGVKVLPFEAFENERRLPQQPLRQRLATIIQQNAPDLVHANSLSMSRLAGPVVSELAVPSIGHLRDILRLSAVAIDDLNRHTRLLTVSQATRQWHAGGGLAADKTYVQHNGVDLDRFCPRKPSGYLHQELKLSPDAKLIGAIGQIGMRKGLDLFLQAAAKVATEIPEVHFLLVGQRFSQKEEAVEYEQKLHHLAHSKPLTGRCHFLGFRDDIPMFLNELTILVHAARQEPLGRVLLEAAASGVAIVATEVGGTREIFPRELDAALVVEPENAEILAAAMQQLLDNSDSCVQLANSARARAKNAFDAQAKGQELARHYWEVLRKVPQ